MLELKSITAGYEGATVLRNLDLVVPAHSVVALLGANGAGKTTLLRVASRLLDPASGTLHLDGEDVTGSSPDTLARRGVCHVPEGRGVFASLTVRDNLRLHVPPGSNEELIAEALDAFPQLRTRLEQRAGTMSGGEQQMLALAHAYVAKSHVVLLDEPSMGLAPAIVDQIFGYVDELARRGVALLLVEQYVKRALDIADYVYILHKGEVRFAGEPAELRQEEIMASYLGTEMVR